MARKPLSLRQLASLRQSSELLGETSRRLGRATAEAPQFDTRLNKGRGGYRDPQTGRITSRANAIANREYVVALRASVSRQDFALFRQTLNGIGAEISSWAGGINKAFQLVDKTFKAYKGVSDRALGKESEAIDFANRLGLTLPQGRVWSKVFKQFNINSFDQYAEILRNPLKRQQLFNAVKTQEEAEPYFSSPEFQQGIQKWNEVTMAVDTLGIRMENFFEILATTSNNIGGLSDRLIDALRNFNPKLVSRNPVKSVINIAKEVEKTADEALFPGFTGFLSALGLDLSGSLIKSLSDKVSKALPFKGPITDTAFKSFSFVGKGLTKVAPLLNYYSMAKLGGTALAYGQEYIWNRPVSKEELENIELFTEPPKAPSSKPHTLEAEDKKSFLQSITPSFLYPPKEVFPNREKNQKPFDFSKVLKSLTFGQKEIIQDKEKQEKNISIDDSSEEYTSNNSPNNSINVSVGDIIVNVPAGSDGREIGRTVAKEIARSFSDGIIPYDQQLSARLGRVR